MEHPSVDTHTPSDPQTLLAMLRLQIEWGADEALDDAPHNRLAAPTPGLIARPLQPAPDAGRTEATSSPPVQPPRRAVMAAAPIRGQAQQAEELAAAADSVEALRLAVAGFTGCSLRDTASHTLFAEGDFAGGLMLVGEVPDADEDRAGHAFAGASGDLLDRMLASIGLSRAQILIAPLIPWRPPGDRKPNPVEMATCLPFLHRLVALVQPQRLVLMGVRPARALLPSEVNLARLRGRWLPANVPGCSGPIQALPMRHPGHLLANPPARRDAWHDLLLLRDAIGPENSTAKQSQGRDEIKVNPQ